MKKTNNKEENIIFYKLKSTGCGYGVIFLVCYFLFFCVIFFIHHSTLESTSCTATYLLPVLLLRGRRIHTTTALQDNDIIAIHQQHWLRSQRFSAANARQLRLKLCQSCDTTTRILQTQQEALKKLQPPC